MQVLKKLYCICLKTGQVFRQEVHRCLRCYRAKPHGTTKLAPVELMFPGRKFHTRLPERIIPRQLDFKEMFQRDLEKKMKHEGACRQGEERKNFGYTGWGCSVGETKTPAAKPHRPMRESRWRCNTEREHKLWPKGEMAAPLKGRRHISRRYPTRLGRRKADGS